MENYFFHKFSPEALEILKTPPEFSTIRVNTLKITVGQGLERLREIYPHLEISVHPTIPDLICIASIGPIPRLPQEKSVYVDYKCAEAVLRGASVYCPGILGSSENCD